LRPFVLITNGFVYVGENKTPTRRCQTGRYEVTTTAEQAVRDGDLCWNHADGPDIVRRRAEARSAAGQARAASHIEQVEVVSTGGWWTWMRRSASTTCTSWSLPMRWS